MGKSERPQETAFDEIKSLYFYIRKNPNKIGEYVRLLREFLHGDQTSILGTPRKVVMNQKRNVRDDQNVKLKDDLNDLMRALTLDKFRNYFN